jgi:hypothetical protein
MTAARSSDHQTAQVLHEAQALRATHRLPDAKPKGAKLNLRTGWQDESGE